MTLAACDMDSAVVPTAMPADSLFWTLRINYPAVRLSKHQPFDSVQLSAIPYSASGLPVDVSHDIPPTTTWYSTDSTLVRVTQDGLVTARGVTGTAKVYIVARSRVGNITREDRAMIQVVDEINPPVLRSFQARPLDSLKRAAGTMFVMAPRFLDQNNVVLTGLPVHYRSSNTIAMPINDPWSNAIMAGKPLVMNVFGTSHIVASTMAFGVALVDTFTLEVGYPIEAFSVPMPDIKSVNGVATPYLLYPSIDIGPGGIVSFTNGTDISSAKAASAPGLTPSNGTVISYIFDDSLNVKSAAPRSPTADGNIHALAADTLIVPRNRRHFRKFLLPGRYGYTVQPYGFRGFVVVHDR